MPKFVCHYDFPNEQWNVFKIVNGQEEFFCSFLTAEDATDFCNGIRRLK